MSSPVGGIEVLIFQIELRTWVAAQQEKLYWFLRLKNPTFIWWKLFEYYDKK